MAKKSGPEQEHHIVGVRLRVTGGGNFLMRLEGLDNITNQELVALPLTTTNRIEPTRLANYQSQRTRLVGRVTEINENFLIRRIIIFAKPVAMEYPM